MQRVAIIHDWLTAWAGSERVLSEILSCYPQADVFTLVDFLPKQHRGPLAGHTVHTSFLQRMPYASTKFRSYLALMPMAIEQFDLRGYDLVISSSHAVAKGVITQPDQVHVSYVHTPMRYAWCMESDYLEGNGVRKQARRFLARPLLHYLRQWDSLSANRPDSLLANSQYVAARIWKTYRREAAVVYPPVDVSRFSSRTERQDFYLCVSRLVPYKRVDLVVAAFARLHLPLVVIGDGPELGPLRRVAGANTRLLGYQSDESVRWYLERCRAFLMAADEDFGIAAVEAQAAGAPVIAYGRGGALETVLPGETGLLFSDQTVESVAEAVSSLAGAYRQYRAPACRASAERFSVDRFRREFSRAIDGTLPATIHQQASSLLDASRIERSTLVTAEPGD